jgi:predicted O-linked N-acetylglucosamine transferase (SPINDLY family)
MEAFETARKHYEIGDWPGAEGLCRQVLQSAPDHPGAWHLLGLIAARTGRNDLAIDHFREAVRLDPNRAEAHCRLGYALLRKGDPESAVASLQRALAINAGYPEAHHCLGAALLSLGRPREAATHFEQAVRLRPGYIGAHLDLGNALREQGRLEEAASSYAQAVWLRPDHADARNNLGNALMDLGRWDEAEAHLREAIRLRPDEARAAYNLGLLLWTRGRVSEAEASYREAVRIDPGDHRAHLNLGNALKDQGRIDEAIASYRTAVGLDPDNPAYHDTLILAMHYHPAYDQRTIGEECRRCARRHAERFAREICPHDNRPDPERRLRVGYVSPEFRDHIDGWLLAPLLRNHDHDRFEVVCYARVARPDAHTERLRGLVDSWRDTAGLSDRQTADLIRDDRVDILVDLKSHTANGELLVFARKPAPVQVTWLGYPGTTGLSTIDYRLTDPYLDPLGLFDACYSEESVRLPETFWCYDAPADSPPVNPLPAMDSGAITFGCLNNFCKVNDGCLTLWAEVLRAVPGSRLLLMAPRGPARDHVQSVLGQRGIAADRLGFVEARPRSEYLKLYQRIDLVLDTLPYNGHTTNLDALWMGVPVLTMLGRTVVGRAGWSQLCNLGLEDLAAETPEAFVALATRLAGDLPRLWGLRGALRPRMSESPLMDAPRFARHVEQAYRRIWRRWCEGRREAGRGSTAP